MSIMKQIVSLIIGAYNLT